MSEMFGGIGSMATLGRAGLGEDEGDLGERADGPLDVELHRRRLGECRARDAHRVQRDVLLVERRDELLAQPHEQQQQTATNSTVDRRDHRERRAQRPGKRRRVDALQRADRGSSPLP